MKRARAGFTLLELMAAVVVFGLVYTVVARVAIQGLQAEGDAGRRLRASFVADRVLSDIEMGLSGGVAPEVGETESTDGDYTVVVEVTPFDIGDVLPPEAAGSQPQEVPTSSLELLSPTVRGSQPTLLSIAVRVSWLEGLSEREVTRRSFAFDAAAAAPLLEAAGLSTAGEEPGEEEEAE
jgi:prepilin-type N-terminal cleavage/methylation domain-containing protein